MTSHIAVRLSMYTVSYSDEHVSKNESVCACVRACVDCVNMEIKKTANEER